MMKTRVEVRLELRLLIKGTDFSGPSHNEGLRGIQPRGAWAELSVPASSIGVFRATSTVAFGILRRPGGASTPEWDRLCIRGPSSWRTPGTREYPHASVQDSWQGSHFQTGRPLGVRRMNSTARRVPRIRGFPVRASGSTTMRSERDNKYSLPCQKAHPYFDHLRPKPRTQRIIARRLRRGLPLHFSQTPLPTKRLLHRDLIRHQLQHAAPQQRWTRDEAKRLANLILRCRIGHLVHWAARQQLQQTAASRVSDQRNLSRQLCALFKDRNRRINPAQIIHQPVRFRLSSHPDAPLRERVDLVI